MATESITETTVKQSKQMMDRGHCWEVTNKHFELILTQMISIMVVFSLDYNNSVRSWIQINRINHVNEKLIFQQPHPMPPLTDSWLLSPCSSVGLASLCQTGLNRY